MPWIGPVIGIAGGLVTKAITSNDVSSGQQAATGALQPYASTGGNALARYGDIVGLNGPDAASTARAGFQASPGYQYQLDQGIRGVDAGAASKGYLRSGATIKAETTLGQNLANQDFGNYVNRLASLAGIGQTAASNNASIYTNAAGKQAGIDQTFGNTLTEGAVGLGKNLLYKYGSPFGGSPTTYGTGDSLSYNATNFMNDPNSYNA